VLGIRRRHGVVAVHILSRSCQCSWTTSGRSEPFVVALQTHSIDTYTRVGKACRLSSMSAAMHHGRWLRRRRARTESIVWVGLSVDTAGLDASRRGSETVAHHVTGFLYRMIRRVHGTLGCCVLGLVASRIARHLVVLLAVIGICRALAIRHVLANRNALIVADGGQHAGTRVAAGLKLPRQVYGVREAVCSQGCFLRRDLSTC
jgi:hypothetical protein